MNKKIYVSGMHCVACEKVLEDELGQVPFVKGVKANRKSGVVEITYISREPNTLALEEIVKKIGYEVANNSPESTKRIKTKMSDWFFAVIIAILVLFGIRTIQKLGLVPNFSAGSEKLGISVSFLIGLTASVSSCLAVVGGVIIAFSQKYKSQEKNFWGGAARPNIFFHVGRVGSFFLLGGLLGFLGGQVNISGSFLSFYTIFVAVVMFMLALNILGLVPPGMNFSLILSKGLTRHWSTLKDSNHKAAPFALGALSFFLPCGFTQSMQLFALASGSFWTGGFVLMFFALGTLPVLLALGIATSWTRNRKTVVFQKTAGLLVLIFSLYTLSSGLAISGMKGDVFSTNSSVSTSKDVSAKPSSADDSNVQVIRTNLSAAGFDPSTIKIKKGVPVKWIINGDQASGCTDKIIIPSLNITKSIVPGDNVVTFTPTEVGNIPFSCWMGMVRGKFIVE